MQSFVARQVIENKSWAHYGKTILSSSVRDIIDPNHFSFAFEPHRKRGTKWGEKLSLILVPRGGELAERMKAPFALTSQQCASACKRLPSWSAYENVN